MQTDFKRSTTIVALALLATVLTQVLYVTVLGDAGLVEGWGMRSALWTTETIAFALAAVAALVALVSGGMLRTTFAGIAVASLFNAIQAGIGLGTFLPLGEAGDTQGPVLGAMLGFAFLFYFLAKSILGLAAIAVGRLLLTGSTGHKVLGGLAILAGLAAFVLNGWATLGGQGMTMPAGAAGTVATALLASALLWLPQPAAD